MAYGVLFFTGQHGVTNGVDRDIFMHHCGYGCIHIDRQIRHSIKRPLSWMIVLICAVCGYSYVLVSSYTSHSSTPYNPLARAVGVAGDERQRHPTSSPSSS